jgi:hypothetical protein
MMSASDPKQTFMITKQKAPDDAGAFCFHQFVIESVLRDHGALAPRIAEFVAHAEQDLLGSNFLK